jgi:Ca2+-binding EF-hand superfamily protein
MNKITVVSLLAAITATSGFALACPGHEGGKQSADANKDGKVTLQEAQAKAKVRFDAVDKNKNGVLSKDELEGRAARMLHADTNKDGSVTFAESQAQVQVWFQKMDTNKDGALSGDELAQARHGRGGHEGHGPKA